MNPHSIFPRRFLQLLRRFPARRDEILPRSLKQIWYYDWQGESNIVFPFGGEPFACILWNNRKGYISHSLIEQLLQAKCTYLVIGGEDCKEWDDKADHVFLEMYFPDYVYPDEEHLMTTSHDGEPLEEILEYGLLSTSDYQGNDFEHFLIVQIDPQTSPEQLGAMLDRLLE